MKNHSFLISLIFFILLPCLAPAMENPDELYKKGDFKKAEKAYNELDMNNPRKFEYRYNRGCAAYKNKDWKGAAAAFSSVLKRTEDKELRFRATFNLGNALYKMEDFQGAKTSFEKALEIKPGDKSARKNLELALKEIEKKKQKEKDKQKEGNTPPQGQGQQNQEGQQDQGKGPQEGQQQKGEKGGKENQVKNQQDNQHGEGEQAGKEQGEDKQQQTGPNENQADKENMNDKEAGQASQRKEEGKAAPEGKDVENRRAEEQENQAGSMDKGHKDAEPDLAGTLSAANGEEAPKEEEKQAQGVQSPILLDRKKAESMLDNVQENPSRMLLYNSSGSEPGKERKAW